MYKKLLITILSTLTITGSAYATTYNKTTFKGFQNLENLQKLNVINKLQAIADNDGVGFTNDWPQDAFEENNYLSYIYLLKNEPSSLDIIKFDIPKPIDTNNCYTKENPEFCIQRIYPNTTSYIYNERLIINKTPDFINKPNEQEISEILVKDNKYFDTKPIKFIKNDNSSEEETYRDCSFDDFGYLSSCRTLNKNTDDLLYTEELIRKDETAEAYDDFTDNLYKYVKYDSDGDKVEEYFYANNKHLYYNKKGEIIEFIQYTPKKFKYYNTKLPDLYIDLEITKDEFGRSTEEKLFDKNHKVIRKYTADYDNEEISEIHVDDILNGEEWSILPIKNKNTKNELTIRQ